jgi:HAMP domain-containing protein
MKFLKKILVLGMLVLIGFSSVFANPNITNTSSNIEDYATRKANMSSNN